VARTRSRAAQVPHDPLSSAFAGTVENAARKWRATVPNWRAFSKANSHDTAQPLAHQRESNARQMRAEFCTSCASLSWIECMLRLIPNHVVVVNVDVPDSIRNDTPNLGEYSAPMLHTFPDSALGVVR